MIDCLPLWSIYTGEKGRTLGKTSGIKARCYWEHPWETHWEHIGNLKGTCWEQRKNETTQNLKEKKTRHFECMLSLPIVWMKYIFQNCSSPFLGWANTPIINWGYLFYSPLLLIR
jgi:hypothetical protein